MNLYLNTKIKNKFSYILFVLILILYIAGFYLNEDSAGAGKLDFVHEWKSFLEFKKLGLKALSSESYESSRTPLFLILNSYNFFAYNEYTYRLSNFIFNFFILISYFICLSTQKKYDHSQIIILTSLLLLSPYFRTSAYWAHQENFPFLFYFLSLIFLKKFDNNLDNNFVLKITIIAFISSLSFYSDQKFLFVSLFSFLYLFFKSDLNYNKKILIFVIFSLSSIPAFYLFYIWEGFMPIHSQFRLGFYRENISASISIICFYFIPILITISKKFFKSINKNDLIIFAVVLFLNLYSLPNFNSSWGNGIIFKLFFVFKNHLNINLLLLQIIYILFIQICTSAIYLLLKNNLLNFLPLILIILASSIVERTYNEYFDPLILVLVFTYFKFNKNLVTINGKIIRNYAIYSFLFLVFANIYYRYFDLNAV